MKLQKYVVRAFFKTQNGVDFELLPIFETSKDEVIRKLKENIEVYENFDLYGFSWNTSEINEFGMPDIMTVSEFWKEDGYV